MSDFNQSIAMLKFARQAFLNLMDNYSIEQLNKIPQEYNNNLIWNFAHGIVSTDYMCYSPTGQGLNISKEQLDAYKRGTKPEGFVSGDEINFWKKYAISSLEQMTSDYEAGLFNSFHAFDLTPTYKIASVHDSLKFCEFHEGSHFGYALAMKRGL